MGILESLRRARGIYAVCPSCQKEFPLREAQLFDASRALPEHARSFLAKQYAELDLERDDLLRRRLAAESRPSIRAESVGIGKVVEKIAPSLPGFPAKPSDCRALFEPIDYIVFNGLSARGRVESLTFVDIKSGRARLQHRQSRIREAVEAGKVRLLVTEVRPDEASE